MELVVFIWRMAGPQFCMKFENSVNSWVSHLQELTQAAGELRVNDLNLLTKVIYDGMRYSIEVFMAPLVRKFSPKKSRRPRDIGLFFTIKSPG